ncbi:DUF2017 family protein [Microbacterium sp. 179-I 3D3 NHS]|uniref:DUF2017 family protein n=1 Tax=unclassified Microbacterium TaxID=2609290 RepID=UPI0039A0EE08
MSEHAAVLPLALIEGCQLVRLVDEFREFLGDADADDSALRRLTPNAYPDDPHAASTFSESTREDLLDRRMNDAVTVRRDLAPFDVDLERLTEAEAVQERRLVVDADDLDAWLRTLTAVRLVIADRLGITAEEDGADDGRHDVYDWLGYRLEILIQAADELDDRRKP